jgi:hypothetical protein
MKCHAHAHPVLLLAGALLLGGCAAVNDATMRVLATPSPAWAVVGDKLLTGQALLYTDRSGTLEMQTAAGPALSCMGTMRYTATSSGTVNLRCTDGMQAQLPFTALGETSGYGGAAGGPVSFAYGLEPGPARAWLTPPAGKRLVVSDKSLRLE